MTTVKICVEKIFTFIVIWQVYHTKFMNGSQCFHREKIWKSLCKNYKFCVIQRSSYSLFFIIPLLLHKFSINSLASARIWGFLEKKRLNARGFAWEFLRSGILYRPGKSPKRRGKSSSLHSKKIFCLGVWVFCEWRHKWRTFRPPWPTLSGPGRQLLGDSISLKFLLETRLQSKSFDTLDDLLGFRVQKLWCKLVKIFD